ncbi:hypothetical protein SORBI_3004G168000 [Sorghum bicolor]|uniref:Pectinesterase inhibitor domain-containing protein n=1 Tax=Sorghum bicolor TaxID=4558 RepID=A0A194YQ34_SORBI|nr:hypothetical protein SORBI_3004G168000 [Sorghum bicolor]
MSPSSILVTTSAIVAIILVLHGADATVVTTCKAAAESDKRVDYDFCVLELGKHHESPDADIWGLAKVAALVGAANTGNVLVEIRARLAKPGTDAKTTTVLRQCLKLYDAADDAFLNAYERINERNYAAGKEEVRCDDAFTKVASPSPLNQSSTYTTKISIVCIAITNLIK